MALRVHEAHPSVVHFPLALFPASVTLWGIVAMVKELRAMTPERYAALGEQNGETGSYGH